MGLKDKPEFYKDQSGEWRWRLKADNGEIVGAATEGFKNLIDCEYNYKTLRNVVDTFNKKETDNG
jgi:uncharacterized protein YegP (UPF0339 family)